MKKNVHTSCPASAYDCGTGATALENIRQRAAKTFVHSRHIPLCTSIIY